MIAKAGETCGLRTTLYQVLALTVRYWKSYRMSSTPVALQLTPQSFLASAVSRATSDSFAKQQLSKYPPDRLVIDSSTTQ